LSIRLFSFSSFSASFFFSLSLHNVARRDDIAVHDRSCSCCCRDEGFFGVGSSPAIRDASSAAAASVVADANAPFLPFVVSLPRLSPPCSPCRGYRRL